MSLTQKHNIQMVQVNLKEEKKVEFVFDKEELNEETFLSKISAAVKRVDEYKQYIGDDNNGRTMKMQGVLQPGNRIDIQKHFSKPDYRAEAV